MVRLPDGRFATFDPPVPGETEFNRTEKLFLRRTADAYEVETLDGLIYSFGWRGKEGEERPLHEVRDPNGNRIELVRENDKLTAFIDSGGRRLPVVTDKRGRITEIRGPDPENPGQTFSLVTFRYSTDGDLVEVLDALGHPFRYAYGNHLLLKETDRAGLSFYFMYDSDGPDAKCLRTWGDGDLFLRDLTYDTSNRRTTEINSLGHKTIYEWNVAGLVTAETDPLGGVTKTEWGIFNEQLSITNPCGEKESFVYDELGRRVSASEPGGGSMLHSYDGVGNLLAIRDAACKEWVREYDLRRNIVAVIDPLGHRWQFQVDARGLPIRRTDPLGQSSRFEWNAEGLLSAAIDRTGRRTTYEYDGARSPETLDRPARRDDPVPPRSPRTGNWYQRRRRTGHNRSLRRGRTADRGNRSGRTSEPFRLLHDGARIDGPRALGTHTARSLRHRGTTGGGRRCRGKRLALQARRCRTGHRGADVRRSHVAVWLRSGRATRRDRQCPRPARQTGARPVGPGRPPDPT